MPSSTVPGIESPVTVAENSKASCIGVVKFVFQHATSLKDRRPHLPNSDASSLPCAECPVPVPSPVRAQGARCHKV
jgi:hypothetical protein